MVDMSLLPQSSLDRRLMKSAARYDTPEQMGKAVLGQLTPAQCIVRRDEILASASTMDEIQERRMLLMGIAEHLDWLKSKRDENDKSWPAIARTMKLLSDQIERTNINVAEVSTKLAESHARTYVEAYMLGINALMEAMSQRGMIEVEAEEVHELAEIAVAESSKYIDSRTEKMID